jgi:tyrosyl-tRNA synthetase
MTIGEEIQSRGYFHQCTNKDELFELLAKGGVVFYVGFDCTAKSLHIGNLLTIMLVRLLQQHGNKPIILLGGGTSKIGDPSGKTKARELISDEEIKNNTSGILKSLSKFIKFGDSGSDALLVNNLEWLDRLKHLEFLREYAQYFSISQTLSLDFIKSRLQEKKHLSLLEFSYVMLQSFDFLHLYRAHNCILQIGGSDQWGNITSGISLIHKAQQGKAYGFTVPLLTTASGAKMGKSELGAVWLNEDMMSPYEYFQYWRNVDDRDVKKFAALYCEFSLQENQDFEGILSENINLAKEKLAFRLTLLCHGEEEANLARNSAKGAFTNQNELRGLPTIRIDLHTLQEGMYLHELLTLTQIIESKAKAKRLILDGGVKVWDKTASDMQTKIFIADLSDQGILKITIGKKKHFLVQGIKISPSQHRSNGNPLEQ